MLVLAVCFSGSVFATDSQTFGINSIDQKKRKVTGTVLDDYGPVIGASVLVKGTSTGTITNFDGKFSIEVSDNQILVVSFTGYETQEIQVNGQSNLIVNMKEDAQTLDEVVVTALGIKKDAKKLGYAVSTIGAGELTKTASQNLGSALYGKASGVRIQTAPGGATGSISINVRGLNSITGNNQPLIIVDGVPIRNGNANESGYWTDQRINSNGLADINPEDIETLSILKGASASALYGSEAANGVVMITTKNGKGSKGFGVDLNASITADYVAYMPEYQTTYGPGTRVNARSTNNGGHTDWEDGWYLRKDRNGIERNSIMATGYYYGPKYDSSKEVLYYDGTMRSYQVINKNPWKELFRTGYNQQYNVAITNGTDKGNMRLSYTYVDNLPTQYNSTYKKHNFNLTGSHKISETLKVDYTANYILQDIKNRPYRISRLTNNFTGMFGPYDDIAYLRNSTRTSLGYLNQLYNAETQLTPNEGLEYTPYISSLQSEYYWNILAKEQLETSNRLIASIAPSWQIINGLTLRGRIATDYTTEKIEKKESTEQSLSFGNYSGYYGLENARYQTVFGDIMLNYDMKLTDKLDLSAMVGWTGRTETAFSSTVGTSGGLSVENWFHLNASAGPSPKGASMYKSEFLKTAWLGTLSLSYDNWAYLEGTARQEKISTLAKGNNSFFYPSANASIVYTELMKDSKPTWHDYGKIRLSYGVVGNAPEIYKATQGYTQKSAGGYIYNTIGQELGNENVKPEKKYEWEIGLEGKFFGNRLGFDASFYTNRIEDQILKTTMPGSSGGTSIWMNVGELQNKGFELSLYGSPIRTKDFNWELRTNFSWYRNKVTKLNEGIDKLEHWNLDGGSAYMYSIVGRPMGDIYALMPAKDENGNNIVTSDGYYKLTDEVVRVGNALPKFTGGFATTVTYKDFFFDLSLDYRVGGAVMNTPYQYMMRQGTLVESMKYRDTKHGGLTYYLDGTTCVPHTGTTGPNGQKVYDNGVILNGVKEDGTPNDVMIGADSYYTYTYGWGGSNPSGKVYYGQSVFDNSYIKVRELSIGYNLPSKLLSKFACRSLQVSIYGRNLFYIYRNMPAFDAEASDATNWISQTQLGGSTATTRSFGVSLRASF
nr:SusC/RagA family TonB-linked outer membrane protein [Bacteroides sp. 519]